MVCFLLRLIPVFIIYTAANAQAPPPVLPVPTIPPANSIGVPQPDTSPKSASPLCQLNLSGPGGFGQVMEFCDSAPDQTGSQTTVPSEPLSRPIDDSNGGASVMHRPQPLPVEPVIIVLAISVALGFITGYGVRSIVSHHHRTQSRRRLSM